MAGVNLEDSRSGHLVDPVVVASKIAAIKCRTPDIFVNARVDNFWFAEDPTVAPCCVEPTPTPIPEPTGSLSRDLLPRIFRASPPGSGCRGRCWRIPR